MFEALTHEDQKQLFLNTVVTWKGKVVYVSAITKTGYILRDISTQKDIVGDEATYFDFTPVYKRMGFLNLDGCVLLIARRPVRRMNYGFSTHNVRVDYITKGTMFREGVPPRFGDFSTDFILRSKNFHDSLMGNYPSLKEAITFSEATGFPMAFDRQFGINYDRSIFFRNQGLVGKLKDGRVGVQSIVFNEPFHHLKPLLENINGKDLRNLSKEERLW